MSWWEPKAHITAKSERGSALRNAYKSRITQSNVTETLNASHANYCPSVRKKPLCSWDQPRDQLSFNYAMWKLSKFINMREEDLLRVGVKLDKNPAMLFNNPRMFVRATPAMTATTCGKSCVSQLFRVNNSDMWPQYEAFCGNSKYANLLSKTATCVVSPGITGDLTTMLNYLNAYKACFLAESLGGYSLDDVAIVLKVAVTWFLMYANPRYSSSKPPSLDYQITFGRQASVEKWLHLSLFYSVFLLPCFPCVANQQVWTGKSIRWKWNGWTQEPTCWRLEQHRLGTLLWLLGWNFQARLLPQVMYDELGLAFLPGCNRGKWRFFFLESPTKYVIILVVTVTVKGPHPNDKSLPTSDESQSNPLMRGYHQAEFNLGPSFHQANCDKQESLAKTL